MKERPSIQRLREVFEYRPDGKLIWKVRSSNRIKVGDVAGAISHYGYRIVSVDGVDLRVGMIVWVLHKDAWPDGIIDHENRVRDDDRIGNLRIATPSGNAANCSNKGKTSSVVGVSFDSTRKKWLAQIMQQRKNIYIGRFETEELAAQAYRDAARTVHGEFANI